MEAVPIVCIDLLKEQRESVTKLTISVRIGIELMACVRYVMEDTH